MPDYGAILALNGDPQSTQYLDETPALLTLTPDATATRCTECREGLRWVSEKRQWVDAGGDPLCAESEPADPDAPIGPDNPPYGRGPHAPQRVQFSWMQDVMIQLEPLGDNVTEWVEVSITLPQGTVRIRVEQVLDQRDGNELAGRLIVRTTRPGDPGAPRLLPSGSGYLIE